MRVVLDTNTIVSALLWGGIPDQLLAAATEARIELFTSPPLLAELSDVLAREKFSARIGKAGARHASSSSSTAGSPSR